jgi:hypothetical protein
MNWYTKFKQKHIFTNWDVCYIVIVSTEIIVAMCLWWYFVLYKW